MPVMYPLIKNEKRDGDLYLLRVDRDGFMAVRQGLGYVEYYRVIYNLSINRLMRVDHGYVFLAPEPRVVDHGVRVIDKSKRGVSVKELRRRLLRVGACEGFGVAARLYRLEPIERPHSGLVA